MRVLVGCEESGKVRDAFAGLGHEAWSCDIIEARNGGRHLQMDVFDAIEKHGPWDIIILHPPCTALALSGNRWYGKGKARHSERLEAIGWTVRLWNTAKRHARVGCVLENPTSVIFGYLDGRLQYIQPYEHGHGETKKTGLMLHALPALVPSDLVAGREQRIWKMAPGPNRSRDRSETYQGIADAMAQQWSEV